MFSWCVLRCYMDWFYVMFLGVARRILPPPSLPLLQPSHVDMMMSNKKKEFHIETTCLSMVSGGVWDKQNVIFKRNFPSSFISTKMITNEIEILQYVLSSLAKHDRTNVMNLLHIAETPPRKFEMVLERGSIDVFDFACKLHIDQRCEFTRRAMKRILSIVQSLHAINVAHNDIKPENMVIRDIAQPAESIAFIDFGVSKILQPHQKYHMHLGSDVKPCWLESINFGTLNYRHPSLLERKPTNLFQSDLFACGIVCFVLFTNSPPHDDDNDDAQYFESSALSAHRSFTDTTWRLNIPMPKHVLEHPRFNMWADFIDELCSAKHTTVTHELLHHSFLQI